MVQGNVGLRVLNLALLDVDDQKQSTGSVRAMVRRT